MPWLPIAAWTLALPISGWPGSSDRYRVAILEDGELPVSYFCEPRSVLDARLLRVERPLPFLRNPKLRPDRIASEEWQRETKLWTEMAGAPPTDRFFWEWSLDTARGGRQICTLKNDTRKVVGGRPVALSIWVRGNGLPVSIRVRLRAAGHEMPVVLVPSLDNFTGWKRFEAAVPVRLQRRNPALQNRYETEFAGIEIATRPHNHPARTFAFDRLLLLTETDVEAFPGADQHIPF